jgi:hypothetical protein
LEFQREIATKEQIEYWCCSVSRWMRAQNNAESAFLFSSAGYFRNQLSKPQERNREKDRQQNVTILEGLSSPVIRPR